MFRKSHFFASYDEYVENDTAIHRYYARYVKNSFLEPLLDALVMASIIVTVIAVMVHFMEHVDPLLYSIIEYSSIGVLIIYSLDLLREFAKNPRRNVFLRKHWLDIAIVAFLVFYFILTPLLAATRIPIFQTMKTFFYEMKHIRVLVEFLKK